MLKKFFLFFMIFSLALTLFGCQDGPSSENVVIEFQGLDVVETEYEAGSPLPDWSKYITATSSTGDPVNLTFNDSAIKPDVPGTYNLILTGTCQGKKETKTLRIEIVERKNALITGAKDLTINAGDPLPDAMKGVSAYDPVEGDITDRVQVLWLDQVDNTVPGKTPITYSVRGYNGTTVTVTVNLIILPYSPDGIVANTGKILKIDPENKSMLVEGTGYLNYGNNLTVYQILDGQVYPKQLEDVYIGMDNVYFFMNPWNRSSVDMIVIDGSVSYERIRVRINVTTSITGENSKYHSSITFSSPSSIVIRNVTGTSSYETTPGTLIRVTLNSVTKEMTVMEGSTLAMKTKDLITFSPVDDQAEISVNSISRGRGTPTYPGRMEVSVIDGLLLLVNDVNIEDYLKYVVPSEMGVSFGLTALKAQAVAARTFALNDLKSIKYISEGYHVDDSVSTQVYNNSDDDPLSNQAIAETKGICAFYDNGLISANFYSTSSGATSNSQEVWFSGTDAVPNNDYLQSKVYAKTQSGENIVFDVNSEASMLSFYKLIKFDSYDGDSYFHRWNVSFTLSDLKNRLQTTLSERFKANPSQVLTLVDGDFISSSIPGDIGTITSITAKKRGGGGLIIALEIVTSYYTFNVYGEYNIRMLFRGITLSQAKSSGATTTRTNFSFLPSAFFATEKIGDRITIYGGGFGHGAGMSQYGAMGMANRGYDYDAILKYYYTGITLTDINSLSSPHKIGDAEDIYQQIIDYLA